MPKIIQLRRDLKATWLSVNPLLAEGEIGLETDTKQFKIGDGVNLYSNLPYGGMTGDVVGIYDGGKPDSNYGGIEDIDGGTP